MAQPEPDREAVEALVAAFRAETGYEGEVGHFAFDDAPEVQDELGHLVLEGPKRATAGLAADPAMDPAPTVGQHDVVLDGSGHPLCIIRTDELRTLPFTESDPAFAWDEGEGDRTLAYWRDVHVDFFRRRAAQTDVDFRPDSLVNFERFSVVWPQLDAPLPLFEDGRVDVRPVRAGDRDWVLGVTPDVTSEDGWSTDRCPGLVARSSGNTAGVVVFVPSSERTELVATSVMTEAEGVEGALRETLERLRMTYEWGPLDG